MKKFDVVMLSLMAGVLLLGAKGCSDCDKQKAAAIAICQASGEESQECKAAKAAAEKACAPVVNPTPTPTPPEPPGPVCEAGQTCDCYHNPTGEEWLKATCGEGQQCNEAKQCVAIPPTTCVPACAADEKCVAHGSVPPLTYTCEKIPGPTPPGLIPDEELTGVPDTGGVQTWAETDTAIKRHQALHADKWMDRGGSKCLAQGPAGIDDAFAGIATELARQSIVAGQSITKDGQRSDCIFVNRTGTDLYEEMHLFDYSRACVATGPNAYRGLYRRDEAEQACSDPLTPRVDRFNLKRHLRTNDSTALFYNRETVRWDGSTVTSYCDKIGFTNRLHCPARNECPGYKCEERVACEAIGVSGSYGGKPLWRSDGTVNPTDNPFQATCSNCTWLEICAADGTACKRCETEDGLCKVL